MKTQNPFSFPPLVEAAERVKNALHGSIIQGPYLANFSS